MSKTAKKTTKITKKIEDPIVYQVALARIHGFLDGLREYAWWKDGVQYVGSCGTTLQRAERDFLIGEVRSLDMIANLPRELRDAIPMNVRAAYRPDNFKELSPEDQWDVDKKLGILDWDGA